MKCLVGMLSMCMLLLLCWKLSSVLSSVVLFELFGLMIVVIVLSWKCMWCVDKWKLLVVMLIVCVLSVVFGVCVLGCGGVFVCCG